MTPTLAEIQRAIEASLPAGWGYVCQPITAPEMPTGLSATYIYSMAADQGDGAVRVADCEWFYLWVYINARPTAGGMAFVWAPELRAVRDDAGLRRLMADLVEACKGRMQDVGIVETPG